ncbi:diacylglycerol kinase family protein [bacterium]|nr:diacylglycerol kinase family protein [bacterium]
MGNKQSFFRSFLIASRGLMHGLLQERNSRIQIVVAIIVMTFSLFLDLSNLEYVLISALCFFVIILELINTSIEKLLDVIYPKQNPEIGLVKDIMSGVVLLGALLSVIIGIVVLKDPTISLFKQILETF